MKEKSYEKSVRQKQEIVLLKNIGDFYQMLNETAFNILMLSRITDKQWLDISYIQLLTKKLSDKLDIMKVKFIYENDKHSELFKKSLEDININCQMESQSEEVIEKYIQKQKNYENELRLQCLQDYAKFQIYKLINFIEAYAGLRINKVQIDFYIADNCIQLMALDYLDQCFLENMKDKTSYLKKVRVFDQDKKQQLVSQLDEHRKILVQDKGKVDHKIQFMQDHYQNMKNFLEIDLDYKTPEDHTSQKVFEQINPNNKQFAISEYIEQQKQKYNNDSNLYRMHHLYQNKTQKQQKFISQQQDQHMKSNQIKKMCQTQTNKNLYSQKSQKKQTNNFFQSDRDLVNDKVNKQYISQYFLKTKIPYNYKQNIQNSIPYNQTKQLIKGQSQQKGFQFNQPFSQNYIGKQKSNSQKKQVFISQLNNKNKNKKEANSVQDLIKLNIQNLEKTLPFLLHYNQ